MVGSPFCSTKASSCWALRPQYAALPIICAVELLRRLCKAVTDAGLASMSCISSLVICASDGF